MQGDNVIISAAGVGSVTLTNTDKMIIWAVLFIIALFGAAALIKALKSK